MYPKNLFNGFDFQTLSTVNCDCYDIIMRDLLSFFLNFIFFCKLQFYANLLNINSEVSGKTNNNTHMHQTYTQRIKSNNCRARSRRWNKWCNYPRFLFTFKWCEEKYERKKKLKNSQMVGWLDGWMDGWMDECMNCCIVGWQCGFINLNGNNITKSSIEICFKRQTDRQTDR